MLNIYDSLITIKQYNESILYNKSLYQDNIELITDIEVVANWIGNKVVLEENTLTR
jgi:hypothetical protein